MKTGSQQRLTGTIVEVLRDGKLWPALAVDERDDLVSVLYASGRRDTIKRNLIFVHHHDRRVDEASFPSVLQEIREARAQLASQLDLRLLWEVASEQSRPYTAGELAELYFGRYSTLAEAVLWDALLSDKVYFKRRQLEFVPQDKNQVERLLQQQERARLRDEELQRLQHNLKSVLSGEEGIDEDTRERLVKDLNVYVKNPQARSRELTAVLEKLLPEVNPVESAYELLVRLGAAPDDGRFIAIGGLPTEFSADALREATHLMAPARPELAEDRIVAIDDEETLEVDDAIAGERLPEGKFRLRVFIALVADFVEKGTAIDQEAAHRAATIYLPEGTVRMLPDELSCNAVSLLEGQKRSVLVTEAILDYKTGELLEASIYPAQIMVWRRFTYDEVDSILRSSDPQTDELSAWFHDLYELAQKLRERRRRAGALFVDRKELKVKVKSGEIELRSVDSSSPSRQMVAEFMVLSNYVAARFATDQRIPIIYRVQPFTGPDLTMQRTRLSLFPDFHAGVGLDVYAQLSSPIRRYADLALQRQLVAALSGKQPVYSSGELMEVLANAENVEAAGRELERRAKRYWALRYFERIPPDTEFVAKILRGGATAELVELPIRGALRGLLPSRSDDRLIRVKIAKVDPLRGYLAFEYVGEVDGRAE